LREGSAGAGKFSGGEGVNRELEFLEPLQVSILSEVPEFVPIGFVKFNPSSSGGRVHHTVSKVENREDSDAISGSSKYVRRMETPQWMIYRTHGRLTSVGRPQSGWVKETD
jgi:N-methylhydantoinase B/oxoprolinase/acetone carboxylase alpha subunit